eukprot:1420920-Amphidinium_carterae.3
MLSGVECTGGLLWRGFLEVASGVGADMGSVRSSAYVMRAKVESWSVVVVSVRSHGRGSWMTWRAQSGCAE